MNNVHVLLYYEREDDEAEVVGVFSSLKKAVEYKTEAIKHFDCAGEDLVIKYAGVMDRFPKWR